MFLTMANREVLNFRIKAYAAEAEMLADTPVENTIGVEVHSFNDYIISATEPENPSEGLLWLQIDGESPVKFSATKNDEICLHPIKAYIYNTPEEEADTGWTSLVSNLFKDSKWHSFGKQYLYRDGNEYESITGRWGCASVPFSGSVGYSATTNRGEDSLEVNITKDRVGTDSTIGTSLHCRNKIDLTNYKTLTFKGLFEYENANSNAYYCCWTDLSDTYQKNIAVSAIYTENNTADVVLDVSALEGEHEIGIGIRSCRLRLDECYLEM